MFHDPFDDPPLPAPAFCACGLLDHCDRCDYTPRSELNGEPIGLVRWVGNEWFAYRGSDYEGWRFAGEASTIDAAASLAGEIIR